MAEFKDMTKLDWAIEMAGREVVRCRESLIKKANRLSGDMAHLVERLQEREEWGVNSLGEVQSGDQEVDRLCALFETKRQTVDLLRQLKRSYDA